MKMKWIQVFICGIGLLSIVAGLIVRDSFRKDMLAGSGEASVGPLSVKGAAVLVLTALLLVGVLYPTYQANQVGALEEKLAKATSDLATANANLKKLETWTVIGTLDGVPSSQTVAAQHTAPIMVMLAAALLSSATAIAQTAGPSSNFDGQMLRVASP